MADVTSKPSPVSFDFALLLTVLVTGLCYWLWQDVRPILRPFKGEIWIFLKDLRYVVHVLAVFLLVTVAGYVFDRSGALYTTTRIVMGLLLVILILGLISNGTLFKKQIEPTLKSIGIERPAFLRSG